MKVGLEIYSIRKTPYFHDYSQVEAFRYIYRCIDLSSKVCTIHHLTQCLCLQSRILLCILQATVTPKSRHVDEISHMDVTLLNCILRGRLLILGIPLLILCLVFQATIPFLTVTLLLRYLGSFKCL